MNDGLKIKVWDTSRKEWVKGIVAAAVDCNDKLRFYKCDFGKTYLEEIDSKNFVPCLSSGRCDEDDNLLYEGDIVDVTYECMIEEHRLRGVISRDTYNGWEVEFPSCSISFSGFGEDWDAKLVGNLFENEGIWGDVGNEPKFLRSNKMIKIISYMEDNTLIICSDKKRYSYINISPWLYKHIAKLIDRKCYGEVWQILRQYDTEE